VKVTIGLIMSHGFPVPAPFLQSMMLLQRGLLTGEFNRPGCVIDSLRLLFSHAFPTDVARNEVVRLFLDKDTDSDHLLFLDADMTHPPDIAHRLLRHRSDGESVPVDIVTARYTVRKSPFFTVAMRKTGPGPREYQAIEKLMPLAEVRGLLPIDAAGAGALMLSRRLLTDIRARCGDEWFKYQVAEDGLRSVSEDMWCYEQAKACGYQPYLDADVQCGHIAVFEVNPKWHEPYADAFLRAAAQPQAPAPPRPRPAHWPTEAVAVADGEDVA
jgi:hypothetical protein